jgi:hypothetical protein
MAETFTPACERRTPRIEAEPDMPLIYGLRAFAAAWICGADESASVLPP